MAKVSDERSDEFGLEGLHKVRRHDGGGHTGAGNGGDGVHVNVARLTLSSERLGQSDQRKLHGGIVRLTEVTVQTRSRRSHDDATCTAKI